MSKTDIEVIAFHGWGFDSSFWNPIKSILSEEFTFKCADRGYFLKPYSPEYDESDSTQKVVFAHSNGVHTCSDTTLNEADHLFIFGGFLRFYSDNRIDRKKKKLLVRQWITQIIDQPKRVLNQFYKFCFEPDEQQLHPSLNVDHDKLLNDLTKLDNDDNDLQRFYDVPQITILHGSDDQIISQDQARKMYHSLRFNSQYFEILNTGHSFPFTHPKKCADIIKTVLSEKKSNE